MVSLRFLVACTVTLAPVALAGPITGLPDTPADALRTVEGSNVKIPDIRKRLDNISSPNEDPNLAEPNNKEGESQVPNLDSLMSSILVQVNDLVNNSTEGTPNVNRIGPLLDSTQSLLSDVEKLPVDSIPAMHRLIVGQGLGQLYRMFDAVVATLDAHRVPDDLQESVRKTRDMVAKALKAFDPLRPLSRKL